MYNGKLIIAGLAVFVALFTSPFWLNLLGPEYKYPELALPQNATECVENRDYMRAEHMQLLNVWRDMALREGKRVYVNSQGKEWEINLQNTCMNCHANKAEFCDKCHDTNAVKPYCWDCHVEQKAAGM